MAKRSRRYDSLFEAIQKGTAADVRQLLETGADPNEIEEIGDVTPLMYAAIRGDLEIVQTLVKAGADVNALAVDLSGDLDDFLDGSEADQNSALDGVTALVYATLYEHVEVRQYLAERTEERLRSQAELLGRRAQEAGEE